MATDNSLLRASETFNQNQQTLSRDLTSKAFAANLNRKQIGYAHELGRSMVKYSHELALEKDKEMQKLSLLVQGYTKTTNPENKIKLGGEIEAALGLGRGVLTSEAEQVTDIFKVAGSFKTQEEKDDYIYKYIINNPALYNNEMVQQYVDSHLYRSRMPSLITRIAGDLADGKNMKENLAKVSVLFQSEKTAEMGATLLKETFRQLGINEATVSPDKMVELFVGVINSVNESSALDASPADRALIVNQSVTNLMGIMEKFGVKMSPKVKEAINKASPKVTTPPPADGTIKRSWFNWLFGNPKSDAPVSGLDALDSGEDIAEGGITPLVRGFGDAHRRAKDSPANPLYKGGGLGTKEDLGRELEGTPVQVAPKAGQKPDIRSFYN